MMTGLIWLIQLVHYPSFKYVDKEEFADFAKFHASRISWIVLPLMIVELTTGILMVVKQGWYLYNLILLFAIWLSTFLLSVPCHHKLQQGKDAQQIRRLVLSNWPRTFLWSLRSLIWFMHLLAL